MYGNAVPSSKLRIALELIFLGWPIPTLCLCLTNRQSIIFIQNLARSLNPDCSLIHAPLHEGFKSHIWVHCYRF
jgi:hypothetical protein